MGLGHGSQAGGNWNWCTLVVLATGDGNNGGADFINSITRNSGGVGDVSLGGDNHFTGFHTGTGGCWANGGVLGAHMTHGTDIGGVGSQVASRVSGDDDFAGFSGNGTIWIGGSECGWVLSTFWARSTNVGGVSGQVSVGVSGNDILASFGSNRTVWFGGDECGWEFSTFWAHSTNVSGVGGQMSVGVSGHNDFSSFGGN